MPPGAPSISALANTTALIDRANRFLTPVHSCLHHVFNQPHPANATGVHARFSLLISSVPNTVLELRETASHQHMTTVPHDPSFGLQYLKYFSSDNDHTNALVHLTNKTDPHFGRRAEVIGITRTGRLALEVFLPRHRSAKVTRAPHNVPVIFWPPFNWTPES